MLRVVLLQSLLLCTAMILSGCGAGEATKTNHNTQGAAPKADSSSGLTTAEQARLTQSINRIKRHPLTKHFAITTSYPYVITGNLTQSELEHWRGRIRRTQAAVKGMYFKNDPAEVVQIWLFKDAASYYEYNQSLWNASPGTGFGYYLPEQKRMMMNIASGGGTLTHELIHPYIEANFPNAPLWFNEGLASLYEQSHYKGGKVFGLTNWRLRGLQTVINANAMPSLETMMRTNRRQFLGPNSQIYYAQARYLMHYLQSRELLEQYYHQFAKASKADPTGIRTLLGLTGFKSIMQLEKKWVAYVRRLRF